METCFGAAGRISILVKKDGLCAYPPNEESIRTPVASRKPNLRGRLWNAATRLIPRERPYGEWQDSPESYGKWYLKLNTITGTAWVTLCFSMASARIPLHPREGSLPFTTHCDLVINGSLEQRHALGGEGSVFISNRVGDSCVAFFQTKSPAVLVMPPPSLSIIQTMISGGILINHTFS